MTLLTEHMHEKREEVAVELLKYYESEANHAIRNVIRLAFNAGVDAVMETVYARAKKENKEKNTVSSDNEETRSIFNQQNTEGASDNG